MNDLTDSELLRSYARDGTDSAFAELVRRYVDLVYSAAIRMVCDSHLAQDVTQSVFIALAKSASQLTDRPVLSGWLHRTTQNIAAQTVRTDVRRRAREQEAVAMNELLNPESDVLWEQIAPQLDDVLGELSEPDRDAVLLRYFERKSAREMAQILGVSDEAAQKRVNRAVERLRELFARRGVTTGAAGLTVVIAANSVQAAPAGLAAAISVAGSVTVVAATGLAAAKTIVMTTFQKTLIAASLAAVVGAGIYEASQASRWRENARALQQQQALMAEQIGQLERERDESAARLALIEKENQSLQAKAAELPKLRGEVAQLRSNSGTGNSRSQAGSMSVEAQSWVERVARLKARLEQTPEAGIPELQLVTEQDWLNATKGKLETEDDYRKALSQLRSAGENKFVAELRPALQSYMATNNNQFPTDLAELKPHFKTSFDDAILDRWAIVPASEVRNLGMGGDRIVTQKWAVDKDNDQRWGIGPGGYGTTGFGNFEQKQSPLEILDPALKAFMAGNGGQLPVDPSELLPFANTESQKKELGRIIEHFKTMSDAEKSEMKGEVEKYLAAQAAGTK